MPNFPSALDNATSLPNPTGSSTQNSPDHASLHTQENAAIIAAETKLGIGASTPAANTLLFGTGAGTSAWTALTSAQLASVLSDETGSGSAVFANTPTLVTPKADTINEATTNNGVTIDGLNLKDGVLNTANSVITTNINDAAVTLPKLNNSGSWNSSWTWQSWTPTWTDITVGNANIVARYAQVGKLIHFYIVLTAGSTTSVTSSVTFTLPVAARNTTSVRLPFGTTEFENTATSNNLGCFLVDTVTAPTICLPMVFITNGTYANWGQWSNTVPFGFGDTDTFQGTGSYEAA